MSVVVPDKIEPEYGWRVWVVGLDVNHLALFSLTNPTLWPVHQELVAKHVPTTACVAPEVDCTCGIYARQDRNDLVVLHPRRVIGRVALWGKVVPAELGWRAQYAYPSALLYVSDLGSRDGCVYPAYKEVAELARRYGVELRPVKLAYLPRRRARGRPPRARRAPGR